MSTVEWKIIATYRKNEEPAHQKLEETSQIQYIGILYKVQSMLAKMASPKLPWI